MVLEGNVFLVIFILGKERNRAVVGNTGFVQKDRQSIFAISSFSCSKRKHERKTN